MTSEQPKPDGLISKTVKGSAYTIGASAVTMVLGFGRSVLMARLLAPEDFGVVAFALAFLNFTIPFRDFGLDQALIHRQPDEVTQLDDILAVHFSLRLLLTGLFILLLLAATPVLRFFYPQKPMLVPVLLLLSIGAVVRALGATPTAYLQKEMQFKELALLQLVTSLSMTIIGPLMAWQGFGVWAIVGEQISGITVATLVVWFFIRPWHPRLEFSKPHVKWYLNYGKFVFVTHSLGRTLEEFDDFWVGTSLGSLALGYYSKSYEFALYPRRIISDPLTRVVLPLFAKLQDNRLQLSKAYFRFSSLVTRVGFLLAGVMVLGVRPFVSIILGEKWVPMVTTFQLMILYVLLDPLLMIGANLAQAVGYPDFWTRARVTQVIVFVPAVILGSYAWGTNGVALATDAALLIGLVLLFVQNRRLVDVSLKRMLGAPALGLSVALALGWYVLRLSIAGRPLIDSLFAVLAFSLAYSATLMIAEFKEYIYYAKMSWRLLTNQTTLGTSIVHPD
jgi:O-antigen/teichoic acid export membrane protein